MKTTYNPLYLSPTQFAQRIGFHAETVRKMIREGRVPGLRIGNRLRVARAEVEKFETANPVLPRKAAP